MPRFVALEHGWARLPDDASFDDWMQESDAIASLVGEGPTAGILFQQEGRRFRGEQVSYEVFVDTDGAVIARRLWFASGGRGYIVESSDGEPPTLTGCWKRAGDDAEAVRGMFPRWPAEAPLAAQEGPVQPVTAFVDLTLDDD